MTNFNFTKSFIPKSNNESNSFSMLNANNELKRLERINDNMNGLNPLNKEPMYKMEKKIENNIQNDNSENFFKKRIDAMNNIRKD